MSVATDLGNIEILRESGEPDGSRPVCLALHADDARRLPVWLRRRPHLKLSHLLILPADRPQPDLTLAIPEANGRPLVSHDPSLLADLSASDIVLLFPRYGFVTGASMRFQALANRKIYLAGNLPEQFGKRQPLPDFYKNNAASLEKAYDLLEADSDRQTFARRVKAIASGDPGYLPIAPFFEYEHPLTRPRKGDIMIDGGISDMVGAQMAFANAVGPEGSIHGFEPIEWMALAAQKALSGFPWYHLHCAGVADSDGTAEFASLRDSSHIAARQGSDTVTCQLVAIDNFARRENLDHIDCIKLDVEGAELSALKGAEKVIQRDLPRLIICLYHKPADLHEIPLYLHEIAPEYKFRLAHSSPGFTDTILYCEK
ncbi:MAG: FkbM family methyltransferase [Desulfovibrio sp.]|nr:FkbM family methyltransferase [Desulfovibrio sp.]